MKPSVPVLFMVVAAILVVPVDRALAQEFEVPRDGMFHVEAKPAFTFKATLVEDWTCPHVGAGVLSVYAPILPELPGQTKVSSRLFVAGKDKLKANTITDSRSNTRTILKLQIKSDELSPRAGISLRAEYEGTLLSRTLVHGQPPNDAPGLSKEERRQYLIVSQTVDHSNAGFLQWTSDQGLKRRKDEQAMSFAHRVFTHLTKAGKYGESAPTYESRRPSQVCKSVTSDCGGLSLLFVAVMRANDVPARTLFGRWSVPQTDSYGQYHVIAEFFVEKSGWVPVDVACTILHKPKDPHAFFGNADGQFVTFHVDTDLEPAKGFRHAWAQYLLPQWTGSGDFWKEHRVVSKWDAARKPVNK